MAVKRIVPNVEAANLAEAVSYYGGILDYLRQRRRFLASDQLCH
jgi:hypothetical protein